MASSHAFVGVSITLAPPILPVYVQPDCPTVGYLWTPGYWAYDDNSGYYWVPGVWVAPPRVGYLWTPGYWGYNDGFYAFNAGYWGPTVGFYGGVNYGYGYGGYGYYGGRWDGGAFRYNTAITHVNTRIIHNTYSDRTVINRTTNSRASFNGRGGISARPDRAQLAAARGAHPAPTGAQNRARQTAVRTAGPNRQAARRSQPAAVHNGRVAGNPNAGRHSAQRQPGRDSRSNGRGNGGNPQAFPQTAVRRGPAPRGGGQPQPHRQQGGGGQPHRQQGGGGGGGHEKKPHG